MYWTSAAKFLWFSWQQFDFFYCNDLTRLRYNLELLQLYQVTEISLTTVSKCSLKFQFNKTESVAMETNKNS